MSGRIPTVTRFLLIASVAIFFGQTLLKLAGGDLLAAWFGLSVRGILQGHFWQFATYALLHGSVLHILINMLMLFFLGRELEDAIGRGHFIALYSLSALLGGLGWLLLTWPYEGICVGASGAIFGLLSAFAVLFPQREVTLLIFFVFPFTLRAWILAVVLGGIQLLMMLSPDHGGIAYSAHVAGAIAGAIYALVVFRPEMLARMTGPLGRFRAARAAARAEEDRRDTDALLEKVAREGIHSLTPAERRSLEDASRRLRGPGR